MQTKTKVAGTLLAAVMVASFEGLRHQAYLDPVGIPTICFGHIAGVSMGDTATTSECSEQLAVEVAEYADAVDLMFSADLTAGEFAAYTSWTYNVGIAAAKGSTLVRLANAGDRQGACHQLDRWVYAGGNKLPGLITRRAEEKALCLRGLGSASHEITTSKD